MRHKNGFTFAATLLGGCMKLIVYDDNKIDCALLKQALTGIFSEIDTVSSISQFNSKIHMNRYDLCIIDHYLEGNICGTKVINEFESKVNFPYILISGETNIKKIDTYIRHDKIIDIINKPFDISNLIERVKECIANYQIQEMKYNFYQDMNDQLDVANELMLQISPQKMILDKKLRISWDSSSKYKLGGDFTLFFDINQDKSLFIFGDVSGHGIKSTLLVSSLCAIVNSMMSKSKRVRSLISILNQVNQEFNTFLKNDFVCCIFGLLDKKKQQIEYINLGMKEGLRYNSKKDSFQFENQIGDVPMGWKNGDYQESSIIKTKLNQGESLFFFTDGIYENPTGDVEPWDEIKDSISKIINSGEGVYIAKELNKEIEQLKGMVHDDSSIFNISYIDKLNQSQFPFKSKLTDLSTTCVSVAKHVKKISSSDILASKVELILSELLSNIMRHSHIEGDCHISIDFIEDLRLNIITPKVENHFSIKNASSSLPGEYSESGYGISIIKNLSKSIKEIAIGDQHVTSIYV